MKKFIASILSIALISSFISVYAADTPSNNQANVQLLENESTSSQTSSGLTEDTTTPNSSASSVASAQESESVPSAQVSSVPSSSNSDVATPDAAPPPPKTNSKKASSTTRTSSATIAANEFWDEELNTALDLACAWLNNSELVTLNEYDLYFLCLGTAGKPALAKIVNKYIADINVDDNIDATQLAALNATFCGYNVTNVAQKNLITSITNYESYATQNLDTIVFALLALDSNNYADSSDKDKRLELIELILSHQNPDGSFFDNNLDQSLVTKTALALTALSNYTDNEHLEQPIEKAVEFIAGQQSKDGTFSPDGNGTSTDVANVIVALESLNIPLDDERFVVKDETLVDVLMRFVNLDSGFGTYMDSKSDTTSTQGAVLALSSIKKHTSPYVLVNKLSASTNSVKKIEPLAVSEPAEEKLGSFLPAIIILSALSFLACLFALLLKFKRKKIVRTVQDESDNDSSEWDDYED